MTDHRPHRPIKSFVKRAGRMTEGQKTALNELFDRYGIVFSHRELDYVNLFGRDAPVALEIGCGNGDAMIEMAQCYPEINFIGVEVYLSGVGRLLANINKHALTNVRVIMHDAFEVLQYSIPDHSLHKVMIYFPDPWHKKRHHKRRLINSEFISLVTRKLMKGAELHLATDWEEYAQQMNAVCGGEKNLVNLNPEGGPVSRPKLRPLTKFEQRGQLLGHGVWDFIYRVCDE